MTVRSIDTTKQIIFQKLIQLRPGFQRIRIPHQEIEQAVDLATPFNVELIPNDDDNEVTLFFGLMDFVRELSDPIAAISESGTEPKKIKCVVWDLDNTLWEGTLVEDGIDKLILKSGIREVIEELDRRGILQSIASKNNHDEAMSALKRFGIEEYFLSSQIFWRPKSEAVQTIARQLNIGLDTLLFVDDSEFELQEVSGVHQSVRSLNASKYLEIADLKECKCP